MKVKFYSKTIQIAAFALAAIFLSTNVKAQTGPQGLKVTSIDYTDTLAFVKVKAVELNNIIAVSGSIVFDNTSLQIISVAAGTNISTLTGTFGTSQASGTVSYIISEPSANTVNIPNDTIMFVMKFRVINNPLNTYNNNIIAFANAPTPIEIDTTDLVTTIPTPVTYPGLEHHTAGYVSFARRPFLTYAGGTISDTVTGRPVGTTYSWLNNGAPYVGGPNSTTFNNPPTGGNFRLIAIYPNGVQDTSVNTILPAKFASLTGKFIDNANRISWTTLNELNTVNFEIERSINGKDFISVGKVNATGNTTTAQSYSFNDTKINESSVFYYRLKVNDKNGSSTYSNTIKISKDKKTTISLSPNPAKGFVNVEGSNMQQLTIVDHSGRVVIQKLLNSVNNANINISALARGVYTVKVSAEYGVTTEKLVVN